MQEQEAKAAEAAETQQRAVTGKRAKRAATNSKQAQQQAAERWRPVVGEVVEVPKLGTSARVESVKGKKVTVGFGQMSMTLNISEVLRTT